MRNDSSIHTKIAGVSSGPERETRQLALEELRERLETGAAVFLDVVPDPENPYDRDALALYTSTPNLGRVQLGYIQNSNTKCSFCGTTYERYPSNSQCKRCGHGKEDLIRDGLATKICQEMRTDPTLHIYAQVIQITGGDNDRSFGCNIIIRRVFVPEGSTVWDKRKAQEQNVE